MMNKVKSSGIKKKDKKLWGLELAMILLAAIWFIPIYYLIVTTFKSPQEATASPLGIPCLLYTSDAADE
mgnify:CR=1 FL=1